MEGSTVARVAARPPTPCSPVSKTTAFMACLAKPCGNNGEGVAGAVRLRDSDPSGGMWFLGPITMTAVAMMTSTYQHQGPAADMPLSCKMKEEGGVQDQNFKRSTLLQAQQHICKGSLQLSMAHDSRSRRPINHMPSSPTAADPDPSAIVTKSAEFHAGDSKQM
jgi:hypothetical protein